MLRLKKFKVKLRASTGRHDIDLRLTYMNTEELQKFLDTFATYLQDRLSVDKYVF